ncbi:MAG TPA: restriction endonuclease subunit S [Dehalococcoidia bacterium]|nr:restriction endonuclease subunit S [Dehalococcoidia bacterium]
MAGDSTLNLKSLHLPKLSRELPQEWCWSRLDDLCVGIYDCPHSTPQLVDRGPLIARSQDIITGVFRSKQAAQVSEETYRERTLKAVPTHGDLLYSREGTYFGIAAEVPEHTRVCLGQRMVLIRPRTDILNFRYLRYWLNSPVVAAHVRGFRDGTVAERLNLPTIRALPVALPPLTEQRAIAHILGTLDDKIELNRRMSETLEAMARALFKSWFVDFEPVRAKLEGRWRRGESRPGLRAHLYDLFPDRLVASELGEIPEGWEVGTLADVASLNPEVWSKQTRPPKINYIDLSNTKWGRIEAVTVHDAADAPSRAQRVLRPGDTIVGTVRPGNGSYAFISDDGLTGSTGFAVLRPVTTEHAEFVYLAATTSDNIDALAHLADGGAYPAVRPEVVAATPIVRPGYDVLVEFSRTVRSLLTRIALHECESRTLAALRDALLPKLISGQLRVKDPTCILGTADR